MLPFHNLEKFSCGSCSDSHVTSCCFLNISVILCLFWSSLYGLVVFTFESDVDEFEVREGVDDEVEGVPLYTGFW